MGMVACFTALPTEVLNKLVSGEEPIEEYLYPDDGESEPPHYIDLDKAWHGIHYLLSGSADSTSEPQSLAVFGGVEFGPEVGLGPARFLTSEQVAQVAAVLAPLNTSVLAERFNPQDMESKEIYPEVIWVRDGADALDYLLENFQVLQVFYRDAAARGDAVIQWLS